MLRDMCVFAKHDLTRDPPFSRLDLILCRNVLIYLDSALQKRLVSVFHYALNPSGSLMLGPAETPGTHASFTVVDKKWRLFRKEPGTTSLPLALPSSYHGAPHPSATGRRPALTEGKTVHDEVTRLILDRYAPPGVVVDVNGQIVQFRGQTGSYLEAAAGEPSLNILKMARSGLLHPLRTALQQAKRRSRTVRKDPVHVQRNGDWIEISLEVVPLTTSNGEHYLVVFDDSSGRPAAPRPGKSRSRAAKVRPPEARVSELRRELAASREYLQSIIQELEAANEELQSANEEILSSNEELQSTNEELDTAKEELQSTNEELNTVNEELHSRNDELTRVNSDLTNLLGSVEIPIVIVDSELGIRRFTPKAEQLFNLIPGDIGRPIRQIKPNFACDDLEGLIHETIDSIRPIEREMTGSDGRWLSLRIRPYKTVDNRLDGAVLTVVDIDASKRYQAIVEDARDHFRGIVDAVPLPMAVVDGERRVQSANARFLETTGLAGRNFEGRDLGQLGDGNWPAAAVAAALDEALRTQRPVNRVIDGPKENKDGRRWRVTVDAVPLLDGSEGWSVSLVDLTERHERS